MQAASSHRCRLAFCALLLTLAEPSTLRAQATAGKAATPSMPVKDLPVTSQDTQRYTGMYSIKLQGPSARSMSLRIFEEKGALLGQIDANAPTRMLYQGNDAFRPEAAPVFLVTFTQKSGAQQRFR